MIILYGSIVAHSAERSGLVNRVDGNDSVIKRFYLSGFSLREVAAVLGVDRRQVKRRLQSQGVEIRPPNSVTRSQWLVKKTKK